MTDFKAKRVVRVFEHEVAASPERVFPLLCPVREYDWIPGWSCDLVFSESGVAENNCIFRKEIPGVGLGIWTVCRHEPDQGRIEFVITYPKTHVERLDLKVTPAGEGRAVVRWRRTYTGLNEHGNQFVTHVGGEQFDTHMAGVSRLLEHYCRTGERLEDGFRSH